jgi:hypothetical protein
VRIHLDTNLLISKPRWELLPPGDHEFLVSAIAVAEFSEGTAHPDPNIAVRSRPVTIHSARQQIRCVKRSEEITSTERGEVIARRVPGFG